MSTLDHARVGLLAQRQGVWGSRRLLDAAWIAESRTPCAVNSQYGLLWWLNTGQAQFPGAPESVFAARGAGSNVIVVDPEHELVAVVRWIDKASMAGFARLLMDSVTG
jgi:CubicO group peptidase (beta-lactamase class C family)